MTYILCCPQGTWDLLAPEPGPPIVGGDWIFMGTNQADFPESGYGTWGAAVDFCIAQGGDDLCPFDSKIVMLSRFVALFVSLIQKVSLFQTRMSSRME